MYELPPIQTPWGIAHWTHEEQTLGYMGKVVSAQFLSVEDDPTGACAMARVVYTELSVLIEVWAGKLGVGVASHVNCQLIQKDRGAEEITRVVLKLLVQANSATPLESMVAVAGFRSLEEESRA